MLPGPFAPVFIPLTKQPQRGGHWPPRRHLSRGVCTRYLERYCSSERSNWLRKTRLGQGGPQFLLELPTIANGMSEGQPSQCVAGKELPGFLTTGFAALEAISPTTHPHLAVLIPLLMFSFPKFPSESNLGWSSL